MTRRAASFVRPEILESPSCSNARITASIRLDRNESSEEPSVHMRQAVLNELGRERWSRYPDPCARDLKEAIGAREGLPAEAILLGNGSNSLLLSLFLALAIPERRYALAYPTFGLYAPWIRSVGSSVAQFCLDEALEPPLSAMLEAAERDSKLVFLVCRPNNPTATLFPRSGVVSLLERGAFVIVDEAYVEFSGDSLRDLLELYSNLVLVRTLSKAFALAAARVGYMLGDPALLSQIEKVVAPYSLNLFGIAAALAALREPACTQRRVAGIVAERDRLFEALRDLPGATLLRSYTNFIYLRPEKSAADLHQGLLDQGILVRCVAGMRAEALRVTIGRPDENRRFVQAWKEIAV